MTQSDAYKVFKLVADRGGFDATCQRRAWAAITREWHEDLMYVAKNVSVSLKKWYNRHLLGYERHISTGCPIVLKSFKVTGKGAAAAAGGSGAGRQQRAPRKRAAVPAVKVKQEPLVDEDSSSDDDDDGNNDNNMHNNDNDNDDDVASDEERKSTPRKAIKPGEWGQQPVCFPEALLRRVCCATERPQKNTHCAS